MATLEAWARGCDAKELPELLGRLEVARAIAGARLQASEVAAATSEARTTGSTGDRWMSLQEAAALLSVNPKWLWRHRGKLPFVHALGVEGALRMRVSERELREHMASKRRP
jgi:hypothetical protein